MVDPQRRHADRKLLLAAAETAPARAAGASARAALVRRRAAATWRSAAARRAGAAASWRGWTRGAARQPARGCVLVARARRACPSAATAALVGGARALARRDRSPRSPRCAARGGDAAIAAGGSEVRALLLDAGRRPAASCRASAPGSTSLPKDSAAAAAPPWRHDRRARPVRARAAQARAARRCCAQLGGRPPPAAPRDAAGHRVDRALAAPGYRRAGRAGGAGRPGREAAARRARRARAGQRPRRSRSIRRWRCRWG